MRKTIDISAAITAVEQHDEWSISFAQLAEQYLACPGDGNDASRLKRWTASFGHLSAWAITSTQIATAAKILVDGGMKPSSVNREISTLGSMYKWIISAKHCPRGFISPTIGVVRFKEAQRRVFLEDKVRESLRVLSLQYPDRRFGVFVHLLLDTGARRSEIEQRTWREIDLDRREIILHDSKTGVPRVLHFQQATADLIRKVAPHRPADAYAFPGRHGEWKDYRKAWGNLTTLVGQEGLHLHDLRHDAARRMLNAGNGLAVVASALGHGVKVLEARYGHLATTDQRRAVESSWGAAA
jgi:integrase